MFSTCMFVATIQTQNCFSFDWISSWTGLNKEFSMCKVLWKLICFVFSSFLFLIYVQFIWRKSKNKTVVALSLSTALIPGEKCSPVALRLAEPWSRAGLGCLATALATLFRDGERLWRADTLFWSALLTPTSKEERQDYTNMQTSVKCTAEKANLCLTSSYVSDFAQV